MQIIWTEEDVKERRGTNLYQRGDHAADLIGDGTFFIVHNGRTIFTPQTLNATDMAKYLSDNNYS